MDDNYVEKREDKSKEMAKCFAVIYVDIESALKALGHF